MMIMKRTNSGGGEAVRHLAVEAQEMARICRALLLVYRLSQVIYLKTMLQSVKT